MDDLTDQSKVELIGLIIYGFGGIDGEDHKQWVLDQILRVVHGPNYDKTVSSWEDAQSPCKWDTGTMPKDCRVSVDITHSNRRNK